MKLHFLGTTGYHPNDRRQTACFMLPEIGVILDAGTGIYRARDLIQTDVLHIFLTHAHLDHSIGLTYLFDILHGKDVKQVIVYAEREKCEALQLHLFAEYLFPVLPPMEFRSITQEMPLPGGGQLSHFPLIHPGGSLGFRLTWPGHDMAYVTDTYATESSPYIDHLRDVDLLLHECYFPDGWEEQAELTGHSCITPVAHVAKSCAASRMYLVHINPLFDDDGELDLDAARKIFPQIHIATDHMVVDF